MSFNKNECEDKTLVKVLSLLFGPELLIDTKFI